jgi:hypothetical protein
MCHPSRLQPLSIELPKDGSLYAVLVWWANGDGARRGLVTIVELLDPCPYIFQPPVYGRLIYAVMYKSDCLLTQAKNNPHLPPSPELRSSTVW